MIDRKIPEYLLRTKKWQSLSLQNNVKEECRGCLSNLKFRDAQSRLLFREGGARRLDRAWGIFRCIV